MDIHKNAGLTPRGRPDIDPVAWVAGMSKDFLILFEPVIGLVPVEGKPASDLLGCRPRPLIAPNGLLNRASADPCRPVRCLSLVGAAGLLLSLV